MSQKDEKIVEQNSERIESAAILAETPPYVYPSFELM